MCLRVARIGRLSRVIMHVMGILRGSVLLVHNPNTADVFTPFRNALFFKVLVRLHYFV
jgi:hypothetical protein